MRHITTGLGPHALAVDFGSASLRLARPGGAIALDEPAVLAHDPATHRVLAWGRAAADLIGTEPGRPPSGRVVQDGPLVSLPVRRGALAEADDGAILLRRAFARLAPGGLSWPRRSVVASCSGAARDFEQQALIWALRSAGAGRVVLVPATLAAALGAGLAPRPGEANLVMNLGAGVTEVCVLWGERPVVCQALRLGGEDLDAAVVDFLRREHRLVVGAAGAEALKRRAGVAGGQDAPLEVLGWDLASGHPATVTVAAADVQRVLTPPLQEIGAALRDVLEATPPALLPALLGRGILIVGGGARLRGVAALLQATVQLPVTIAPEPETCVVRGLTRYLQAPALRPAWPAWPASPVPRPVSLFQ
jgi:rod shape-determining protein MreB and related proteins